MTRGRRAGKHRAERRPEDPQAQWDAKMTAKDAEKALRDAQDRQSEISEMVNLLRHIRERNHFGDMVRKALG